MVRIAICDDLQEQLDIIQKAVQQYFHDKKEPTEVFTYNNAMDFVDAFEKEWGARQHMQESRHH